MASVGEAHAVTPRGASPTPPMASPRARRSPRPALVARLPRSIVPEGRHAQGRRARRRGWRAGVPPEDPEARGIRRLWAAQVAPARATPPAMASGPVPAPLETNPLVTKCFTSGVLNAAGDLFAQFMFENAAEKAARREPACSRCSAFLVGPALHFWYGSLNKIVADGFHRYGGRGAALALDQLCSRCASSRCSSSLFTIEGNASAIG